MVYQLYHDGQDFCVWAEPEAGDKFIGICVGVGKTQEAAVADAKKTLSETEKQLDQLALPTD